MASEDFELFNSVTYPSKTAYRTEPLPAITVNKENRMRFNNDAIDLMNLKKDQRFTFRRSKLMGDWGLYIDEANGFPVRVHGKKPTTKGSYVIDRSDVGERLRSDAKVGKEKDVITIPITKIGVDNYKLETRKATARTNK